MAQTSVIVVSLVMLGTLGGLVYVHATRDESAGGDQIVSEPATVQTASVSTEEPAAASAVEEPRVQPVKQAAAPDVTRLIADTQSYDAKTRANAIEALGAAPKAQAIPVLERVLESGEPQVDRQIALRSLHTLALNDGDANGKIRDVMRHAMYHSEDEAVTQTAQALLEDIEAAFDERAQSAR